MDYQINLRKIGVMIHRCRINKRNTSTDNAFTQDGFLTSSHRHLFFDLAPGFPVCSRGTLVRLEQGKTIHEEELYRFFLHKLGKTYQYSPSRERLYEASFISITQQVCEDSLHTLDTFDWPPSCPNNLLYDFYDRLLKALYAFYTLAEFPDIEIMQEIIELWICVPKRIRAITMFFVLAAQSAHPFYDSLDITPVLLSIPKHPMEYLSLAMFAASKERFVIFAKLMARYTQHPCLGELAQYMHAQGTFFTNRILGKSGYKQGGLDRHPTHPLMALVRDAMIFQLGKHAIDQHDLPSVRAYFGLLEESTEPYRVFAKWIINKSYPGPMPRNPKLGCLVIYLNEYRTAMPQHKLDYLMKQVLPYLSRHEAFLVRFMRLEIFELVQRTQRYKPLYDYCTYLEKL